MNQANMPILGEAPQQVRNIGLRPVGPTNALVGADAAVAEQGNPNSLEVLAHSVAIAREHVKTVAAGRGEGDYGFWAYVSDSQKEAEVESSVRFKYHISFIKGWF